MYDVVMLIDNYRPEHMNGRVELENKKGDLNCISKCLYLFHAF
jgi:hypothetical protein